MTNLRERKPILKSLTPDADQKESIIKKVTFAVHGLLSKNKSKVVNCVEKINVMLYICVFVLFLAFSIYLVEYIHDVSDDSIASQSDEYTRLFLAVPCSTDYGTAFRKCIPKKCGRGVKDLLFNQEDVFRLLGLAQKGMKYGGGSGGATILDLHSGALSYEDKFVNIYKLNARVFNESEFSIYAEIKNTIRYAIASEFGIDEKYLYLTKPTFFSRMTNNPARTSHDEYWHAHIDRVTYGTFFYTSLLYLSDYATDFTGGRFMFVGHRVNKSVEPRFGRLSFFTSGSENEHYVERVESGTRYALTVSFTCDKQHAISDPGN